MGCISNSAYRSAAGNQASAIVEQAYVDTAIQVALALWQRNTSRDIANMQNEIADRQMRLAEAIQEHAEKFWPHEKALVDDAFGEQTVEPQYTATGLAWKELAVEALADGRADWLATARQQCMPPDRCEDARFHRSAQLACADMLSFAARTEEARAQEINDRRYERQYKVLNIGSGLLSTVVGFQASSLRAGGAASRMLGSAINSALDEFSYRRSRNNPGEWGQGAVIREVWGAGAPYTPGDPRQNDSISRPAISTPPLVADPVGKGQGEIDAGIEAYEEMLRYRRGG